MGKKIKSEIKLGATVRLKVHSGEIIEGRVVHLWEEKSIQMVRVASGPLVYNVPASMLVDEGKPKSSAARNADRHRLESAQDSRPADCRPIPRAEPTALPSLTSPAGP